MFYLFISLAHFVSACVPSIAIQFNATIALFARALSVSVCKFEASVERGKSHGNSGVRKFEELDAVRDHAQSGEGAFCDCRVLNPVPTCCGVFVFPCFLRSPVPVAVAMVFHVGNNRTHIVSAEEIRVFQACVVVNTKTCGLF